MSDGDKPEILNPNQLEMNNVQNKKRFDLEERTANYTVRVRNYSRKLPKTFTNKEISDQMFRSAASVGANYIEANESLGSKDFVMRIRICRKEAKESVYWLKLSEPPSDYITEQIALIKEGTELTKIFGSIVIKCSGL